jgi:hypothetical protein
MTKPVVELEEGFAADGKIMACPSFRRRTPSKDAGSGTD